MAVQSQRSGDAIMSVMLVSLVAIGMLGIWELAVWYFDPPKILLPTPRQCLQAAVENRWALFTGTLATGAAAVVGLLFALAIGSWMAILFSQSRKFRLAFFPYVVFLQTVPIVAIAPLSR